MRLWDCGQRKTVNLFLPRPPDSTSEFNLTSHVGYYVIGAVLNLAFIPSLVFFSVFLTISLNNWRFPLFLPLGTVYFSLSSSSQVFKGCVQEPSYPEVDLPGTQIWSPGGSSLFESACIFCGWMVWQIKTPFSILKPTSFWLIVTKLESK